MTDGVYGYNTNDKNIDVFNSKTKYSKYNRTIEVRTYDDNGNAKIRYVLSDGTETNISNYNVDRNLLYQYGKLLNTGNYKQIIDKLYYYTF